MQTRAPGRRPSSRSPPVDAAHPPPHRSSPPDERGRARVAAHRGRAREEALRDGAGRPGRRLGAPWRLSQTVRGDLHRSRARRRSRSRRVDRPRREAGRRSRAGVVALAAGRQRDGPRPPDRRPRLDPLPLRRRRPARRRARRPADRHRRRNRAAGDQPDSRARDRRSARRVDGEGRGGRHLDHRRVEEHAVRSVRPRPELLDLAGRGLGGAALAAPPSGARALALHLQVRGRHRLRDGLPAAPARWRVTGERGLPPPRRRQAGAGAAALADDGAGRPVDRLHPRPRAPDAQPDHERQASTATSTPRPRTSRPCSCSIQSFSSHG